MVNSTDKNIHVFLTGLIFSICYSILISYSLGPQSSLDTYWHLQMGKDFLENGLSPWIDHYSFTFPGKEIGSVPVLFQITLATFISIFGEASGFIIFKITYVTLLLFVIYRFFIQIKAPWFVIVMILPMMIYFINMRLIIRPDAISNILIVICLSLYLKARENFASKELILICLLMLFWVNYHTPILGYIIIFGLFLDKAIYKLMSSEAYYTWTHWFLWGALIFFIGFINPTFSHVLTLVFSSPGEWYQYLSEYAPSYIVYSSNKMVILSWIASLCIVIWAVIKKHYGLAFIVAILTYYSLSISRLVPAVSIINFCILTFFLSSIDFTRHFLNVRPALRVAIAFLSLYLFLFTLDQTSDNTLNRLKSIGNYTQHVQHMGQITENKFPAQISDYLNNFQIGGNVLNTFNVGGYLIHTLSPDFKIFIDGRTNILYPVEFYKHYLDILNNMDVLENDTKKYNISYAIFENTLRAQRYFSETDLFTINFSTEYHILFSRNNDIAFPIASKLTLFPMCWDDRFSTKAKAEIDLSKSLFSEKKYTIKFILQLLNGYMPYENRRHFINALQPENFSFDSTRRFAAYLAINVKNYQTARTFFMAIEKKKDDDLLMMAYVLTLATDYIAAKNALFLYLSRKGGLNKDMIPDFDEVIVLKVLTAIQQESHSPEFSYADIKRVKKEFGFNDSKNAQLLSTDLPDNEICNLIFKDY